jgi:tetratricopeptide (TPR) repeat protein
VWEGEPETYLRELVRLEFLYTKGGGGEPVYAFTHGLTRDVAYESLPTARRRTLHGAIARAIETVYADRLGEVYDRLALHYGRTDEADKAVLYLTRLADKAVAAHAHTEAVRLIEEAREHVDRLPAAQQDRRRIELALAQAYSLVPLGAFQELVHLLLQEQVVLEGLDDGRLGGVYHVLLGRSYLFLGDDRQASRHLSLGLTEARRAGDGATEGIIHYVLALRGAMSGHPRQGLEHGRQAVTLTERAGQTWWSGPAHWAVGLNHALLGEFDAALAAHARAAARGAEVSDPQVASSVAWASGVVHILRGDGEAGTRACEEALARSPDPLNTALALGWLGYAWLERDNAGQASPRLEEALRLLVQFRFPQPQAWFSAFLADAHRRASRMEPALELASRALELARAAATTQGIGWAERALGQIAQDRGALADAHEHHVEARRAFEAARTDLDLARLAAVRGRQDEGAARLRAAHGVFRTLGLLHWTGRTEAFAREIGIPLHARDAAGADA